MVVEVDDKESFVDIGMNVFIEIWYAFCEIKKVVRYLPRSWIMDNMIIIIVCSGCEIVCRDATRAAQGTWERVRDRHIAVRFPRRGDSHAGQLDLKRLGRI